MLTPRECVKRASGTEGAGRAVFAQENWTTHDIVHLVFNASSQWHLWPENAGGAEFTPHQCCCVTEITSNVMWSEANTALPGATTNRNSEGVNGRMTAPRAVLNWFKQSCVETLCQNIRLSATRSHFFLFFFFFFPFMRAKVGQILQGISVC